MCCAACTKLAACLQMIRACLSEREERILDGEDIGDVCSTRAVCVLGAAGAAVGEVCGDRP